MVRNKVFLDFEVNLLAMIKEILTSVTWTK